MVELSYNKRLTYSKHQPNFWKMSENSNEIQKEWFKEELKNEKVIALCYQYQLGFIMGKLIKPPEVYDAGLTLMIDDFCVKSPELWIDIGKELLEKCIEIAKNKGAGQVLVVCGDQDILKYQLLESLNLTIASRWYTAKI
jgi:hypothetical protein